MLFAAGLGTRLKPFTDHHPKALAVVNGKPLLGHNLDYLKNYGIERVVINIHHFSSQIVNYLKHTHFDLDILISDETDEVLETGGGLVKAKDLLGSEPFLVMNVDILTHLDLSKFMAYYFEKEPLALLAVSDRKSSRKLYFDEKNQLKGWKNLASGEIIGSVNSDEKLVAFSGVHIIHPDIFDFLPKSGKFSIMTSYLELMTNHSILSYNHTGDFLIDVGKPEAILEAEKHYNKH